MDNLSVAKSAAYRLPEKVTLQIKDEALLLVRSYPLKTIRLHNTWEPAFKFLSAGGSIDFDRIVSCLPEIKPEDIEKFFNSLARKGFLEREGVGVMSQLPFVSVIIPVHNRPEEIEACLMSLNHLDYPDDKLEVIVVDDASDDGTADVVELFDVKLISSTENRQAPSCRNLGAESAKGELLAFLDSDCTVSSSWLKELVPAFRDAEVGAVGGRIDSYFTTTDLDRYEQVNSSLIMGRHDKRSDKRQNFFYVPSCNLIVRKMLFDSLNGFNPDLVVGEDVDLCWRIQDSGSSVEFRPDGTVFHRHRNQLRAFCQRRFDYGTSEPLLQKHHPSRRKFFFLPVYGFMFWLAFFVSWFKMPLLAACPAIVLIECGFKYKKTGTNLNISFFQHLAAIVRSYAALFYHGASFLSRYYLWVCLPVAFVSPAVSAGLLCLHALTGLVNYAIKKPLLNSAGFLFFFTCEQLSYQAGVWASVLRHRIFTPVFPVITFRKKFI